LGVLTGVDEGAGLTEGAGVDEGAGVNEGDVVGLALVEGTDVGLLVRPPVGLPRAMPPDELANGEPTELPQPARIKQTRIRAAATSLEPDLDRTDREEDISSPCRYSACGG
jgi:hypothetical protein